MSSIPLCQSRTLLRLTTELGGRPTLRGGVANPLRFVAKGVGTRFMPGQTECMVRRPSRPYVKVKCA
jgi:hypothetical protein